MENDYYCKQCRSKDYTVAPVGDVNNAEIMVIVPPKQFLDTGVVKLYDSISLVIVQNLFAKAGIPFDSVYITPIIKCGADVNADTFRRCKFILWDEIKLVSPKVLILSGRPCVEAILKSKRPIKDLSKEVIKLDYLPNTDVFVIPDLHMFVNFSKGFDDIIIVLKKIRSMYYE